MQCEAYPSLTVGATKALINLLGTCIVRTNCVLRNFPCPKRFFNLWEKWHSKSQCEFTVSCAKFTSKNNFFYSFLMFDQGICLYGETQKSIQMLLEVCVVQQAQTKSVFTFQPTEILVFTAVKRAKPALTCWIFLLLNKNRQYLFLWWKWYPLVCKKDDSGLRKRKSTFSEKSQSQPSRNETVSKKTEITPFMPWVCQFPIGW